MHPDKQAICGASRTSGSLRHRVASALYGGPSETHPASHTPWDQLSHERQSGWLSDADMIIPIVLEACARVADQRDPEKPTNYLFPRERIGSAMTGLFVGWPDDERDADASR